MCIWTLCLSEKGCVHHPSVWRHNWMSTRSPCVDAWIYLDNLAAGSIPHFFGIISKEHNMNNPWQPIISSSVSLGFLLGVHFVTAFLFIALEHPQNTGWLSWSTWDSQSCFMIIPKTGCTLDAAELFLRLSKMSHEYIRDSINPNLIINQPWCIKYIHRCLTVKSVQDHCKWL